MPICRNIVGGVITPPCGVPISVGVNTSPVNTPAFSQPSITRAKDRCPRKDDVVVNLVEEALDVGVQDPAASCPLVCSSGTFGSQAVFDRNRCIVN